MIEVEFIYQSKSFYNQHKEEETMKDICQKFTSKIGKNLEDFQFLYSGQSINFQSTFNELANEVDKRQGKMTILVEPTKNEEDIKKEIKSKEIICPKCGEMCLINFHDYNITISDCKNNHKVESMFFNEYDNTQKIDESKILCKNCNKKNKNESYEHKFYICLSCKQNLCPLCK